MGFYLGIDLGTSYFKAGIFDENGNLKGLGRQLVKKEAGDGVRCELPVPVFWETIRSSIEEAIWKSGIKPTELKAVSYSSQANSFILLDHQDKPLTPLILWPDRRAKSDPLLTEKFPDSQEFMLKTGIGRRINYEFTISKIKWFQKNQPELWRRVRSVLSISDFLTYMLTGQKVSDTSTSSLTGLLDIEQSRWWNKSLEIISLNPLFLPVPNKIGFFAGPVTNSGAKISGLPKGISFFLGGLDHHCAAIGSGAIQNDIICESTGTILACVGNVQNYNPVSNCCMSRGLTSNQYFKMAFDDNGAQVLEWYQKEFASNYSFYELLEMAEKTNNDSGDLIAKSCANRYSGLNGFENVKSYYNHGHFVLAILKSISGSLGNLLNIINGMPFHGNVVSTGGGARSNFWVKVKARELNCVFYIPECNEAACFGAAIIGAWGIGRNISINLFIKNWVKYKEVIVP
jgi:xylulokinase